METADRIVTLAAIHEARERIADSIHRTPMLASATAADVVRAAGGPALGDGVLYVKADHLQKTGSFKARGMSNRMLTLDADARRVGVITVSAAQDFTVNHHADANAVGHTDEDDVAGQRAKILTARPRLGELAGLRP